MLFHNFAGPFFIPAFSPLPSLPLSFQEYALSWSAAIIDTDGNGPDTGIFSATYALSSAYIAGLSRTLAASGQFVFSPYIVGCSFGTCFSDSAFQYADTSTGIGPSYSRPDYGIWLFRDASVPAVPEPPVSLLIVIGITALWSVRRSTARGA